jgi:hypothetical protein
MAGVRHIGAMARLSPEWVRVREYADSRRIRYGTVKRWVHEGLPVLRSHLYGGAPPAVRVLPALADAWVARHYPSTVAHNRITVVYFARRVSDGAIKIGFTSDVDRRLGELRKEFGTHELLSYRRGSKPDELALHARFKSAHIEGEWFHPTPEVMAEAYATTQRKGRSGAAQVRAHEGQAGHAGMRSVPCGPEERSDTRGVIGEVG